MDQLLHGPGAVIDHFQEDRPALGRDAAEGADNGVVDELRDLAGFDGIGQIRIEDLQEMAKLLALGLKPELLVFFQGFAVHAAYRC